MKLVLLRYGESLWNKENRFTGWTDVDLSEKGKEEAQQAGKILREKGFIFDMAFTSVLIRATRTLNIVLREMGLAHIPIEQSWRLNERHYGALQGLNKAQMVEKHGEKQVLIWRRSYDICPPALSKDDPRYPGKDPKYKNLIENEIPATESLQKTVERFLPFWHEAIVPKLKANKRIIITAHGNSLRALVKHLDHISDEEIVKLNIPTGIPLIYELDADLKSLKHYYLGDLEEIKRATEKVALQGKAKKN